MTSAAEKIDMAVSYALMFVGSPYRWGGETPMGGFDCSGFVQEVLASVGYSFGRDHNSQMMYRHFKSKGAREIKDVGALSFYGKSSDAIGHVGFCISDFQMVEAAHGSSKTFTIDDAIARKAYIKIRPISRRSDLVACLMPNY